MGSARDSCKQNRKKGGRGIIQVCRKVVQRRRADQAVDRILSRLEGGPIRSSPVFEGFATYHTENMAWLKLGAALLIAVWTLPFLLHLAIEWIVVGFMKD